MAERKSSSSTGSTGPQVVTKDQWEQLGVHTVTLPSGARVKIRIPDLTLLLASDSVPEDLRGVALHEVSQAMAEAQSISRGEMPAPRELDFDQLRGMGNLHQYLISQTLVDPAMTP